MALHKFLCPKCHEEVSIPREAIGQRAKCSICGEMVLVPSSEKDRQFRQRLADEQRAQLEEQSRQDEVKRMQQEEERRVEAERERIRLEEARKQEERKQEEERRQEEERKREYERGAEQRRLYDVRQAEERRRLELTDAQQEFNALKIIVPGDSAAFVQVMGVILILAGIVAAIWGMVDAANKQSVLTFIIGAVLALQCFLVAAFFFLSCGVAQNIFYICKNLEYYYRRRQNGKGTE